MAIVREKIGWDLEEATITANNEVASSKNILGTNSVLTTKGVGTIDLDPIKFNSAHNFSKFVHLASIMGLETDKLKRNFTSVFDCILYGDTKENAMPLAYTETADVDVTGMASGNEALQSGLTLHLNGNRTYYTFDTSGPSPTLTPITGFDKNDFSKLWYADGIATRSSYVLYFDYEETEFN